MHSDLRAHVVGDEDDVRKGVNPSWQSGTRAWEGRLALAVLDGCLQIALRDVSLLSPHAAVVRGEDGDEVGRAELQLSLPIGRDGGRRVAHRLKRLSDKSDVRCAIPAALRDSTVPVGIAREDSPQSISLRMNPSFETHHRRIDQGHVH